MAATKKMHCLKKSVNKTVGLKKVDGFLIFIVKFKAYRKLSTDKSSKNPIRLKYAARILELLIVYYAIRTVERFQSTGSTS